MLKEMLMPLAHRKNKKVFLAFLSEGKKASWPVPVYTMYKHYFEYEMNESDEYEFSRWLSIWKDSEEHVAFILRQFSEEQLIELSENYEDWIDAHPGDYVTKRHIASFAAIANNEQLDDRAKKVLACMIEDLNVILTKIKIK